MRRRRVTVASAPIPFRAVFKHAAASRRIAQNVIVVIEDEDGVTGLGEGCPRPYVTGETPETVRAFLHRRACAIAADIDTLADLQSWIASDREIDTNPSAACALELALLDLLARRAEVPVERLLGLEPIAHSPRASAIYGDSSAFAFAMRFAVFGWNGLRDAKLKISGDRRRDGWRARWLARRGRLRLDANNLWPDGPSAVAGLAPLADLAFAVEEPVAARDWPGMAMVGSQTGLVVILDESFLTVGDLAHMPSDGEFAVNVRVSKHGGLIRTVEAVRAAQARGVPIIVGAQVGETSILARAGLAAASAAGEAMIGYEGGYGLHLLAHDVCSPSWTFGPGGVFLRDVLSRLSRPGLGVDLAGDVHLVGEVER